MKNGLSDRHPYPRKTAALGVLKVMDYAPTAVEEAQLLPVLRILLMEDPSPEARIFQPSCCSLALCGPLSASPTP